MEYELADHSEIADRIKHYDLLNPSKFSKRYNDLLYRPVLFFLNEKDHKIEYNFMQQIRRRLSILERPLVTARGDGKSYIYANFNPKYAQYALTILRTFYNYCESTKDLDGEECTPAQRLGISEKKFDIKDILYLR